MPADVLVGKLNKDILPSTRRAGIARQPSLPPSINEDSFSKPRDRKKLEHSKEG
jgi:hypothetical protein